MSRTGWKYIPCPADFADRTEFGEYALRFERMPHRVDIHRNFRIPVQIIAPEKYGAFVNFALRIDEAERQRISLETRKDAANIRPASVPQKLKAGQTQPFIPCDLMSLLEAIASSCRHVAIPAPSWPIRSRKVDAISTNLLPFSMYSGMRCHNSSNFSGCSAAKVATPIPGNRQARWPPSSQEKNCPGHKRANHQRFLPIHYSTLHCCVLWLKL